MNPINISEKAQIEIKGIFENKNIPSDYFLRVGASGSGGCSGVNYVLGFDQKTDNDQSFEIEGIPVLISKKDFMHVIGITIDFLEDSEVRGFIFKTA